MKKTRSRAATKASDSSQKPKQGLRALQATKEPASASARQAPLFARVPQKRKGTAAGRRLVEAMRDVAAFMNGDTAAGRILFPRPPRIDVAAARAKTGLSQNEFARRFMLAPGSAEGSPVTFLTA